MSTFEDGHYRWRETYFVLFSSTKRPALKIVEKALAALNKNYVLSNQSADSHGHLESLTVISPDDFAAMDICYTAGDEVLEQGIQLAEDLSGTVEPHQKPILKRLKHCDGRFDVLHFEQLLEHCEEDEDDDEMLDPSALLTVLETLAKITGGIAVDPQSGTILGGE
jgi:hypothetical protein